MQDNYTTKGKHLTIDSRRLIERWKKEGKSNREIASLLGKAPQTIHTKIKRMMVMAKGVNVGISTIYYWIHRGKLG
ncbi:hypothetical protein AKI88_08610 [Streptococcus pneumoniae]|nr:hypothetical protein AKI88_08610 [Streptococcus pneumoniae]